jgi:hypothetical protein
MDQLRIRVPAKKLGTLALDKPCLRCFHTALHVGFRMPFQIVAGVVNDMDVAPTFLALRDAWIF